MSEYLTLTAHPYLRGVFLTRDGRVFQEAPVTQGYGGYFYVHIARKTQRRHVLLAETFKGTRPPGFVCRHLDGNTTNDSLGNLKWGSTADNCADTVRHGRSTRGGKNFHAKLTNAKIAQIKRRLRAGESGAVLAHEYGVAGPTISNIKTGATWSHVK